MSNGVERSTSAGKYVLIGGGVRSGKSAFALSLARRIGPRRVLIATAQALDAEMGERIARHRIERGEGFDTIEAPLDLAETLRGVRDADVAVVDCLTLWMSNLLLRGDAEPAILAQVDELVATLVAARFTSILVTNEVGMGVHPETALGRAFRDVVGRAHQRLARDAGAIYFAALGVLLRLRPAPVIAMEGAPHDLAD
ncbi:MAG TPA: bifunctional adenosylcobinamide kinase/adenosylcobinamide-phosphate guanylyltransferase [Candidatus Kryptonia bacterium]|nr:bifunctional adenosylcobinamide kinase/adenosylcobinamide-phosphate guanylyltransferase [Candidatus Kryptonia bacterium]